MLGRKLSFGQLSHEFRINEMGFAHPRSLHLRLRMTFQTRELTAAVSVWSRAGLFVYSGNAFGLLA